MDSDKQLRSRIRKSFETGDDKRLALRAHRTARHAGSSNSLAQVLLDQGSDAVSLAAGLLSTADLSTAQLRREFGQTTAELAQAVRDGRAIQDHQQLVQQLDTYAEDPRALAVQIAAHIDALEGAERSDGTLERAREALALYAPLASRLGMARQRRRLEDACFRLLQPEAYEDLARLLEPRREEDERCLELLCEGFERLLTRNGLTCTVEARRKGLYSIHRKMRAKGLSPEQVLDKLGLRVVVGSVLDCYTVLGLVHTHHRPIPGTFDDYIAAPRPSGYRSLHTCVYPIRGISERPVEVQIRTRAMHLDAELGVAAHWRYKSRQECAEETARQGHWLHQLAQTSRATPSEQAFLQILRQRVYGDHIVVFLPHGAEVRLPATTTAGELATQLGQSLGALLVNGQPALADQRLADGDSVEMPSGQRQLSP